MNRTPHQRVSQVHLPLVNSRFYPGVFGDFGDVVRARMDQLGDTQPETIRFYRWLLNEIDPNQYAKLQAAYLDPPFKESGCLKYLDPIFWFEHKLAYAHLLGLHKSKPIRILDIGTGP